MVSDYRQPYGRQHCSSQPRRSGHEVGRMHHHQRLRGEPRPCPRPRFQPHPSSSTRSHDLREAILREIDKESMRQEMIMSEIIRRRAFALEADLRYEMMMERAMALQRGRDCFPSESPRPLAETVDEGRFLEERIIFPPPPRNALNNWREGEGSEAIQLQRAPIDERMARLSEG